MIKTITNRLFLLVTMLLLSTVNALADNVAKIGSTEYATLAEAIAAVPADGTETTITMLADAQVSSSISINANQSVVLDLNGKTITSTAVLFNSDGNLTIKDSGENGAIDVTANMIINSTGKEIKIEGGNLSVHSTTSAIIYGVQIRYGASFEMTGGKITTTAASTSKLNYCVSNSGNGSVIISGGELAGEATGANYTLYITGSGTTTITGGTFSGKYGTKNSGYAPSVIYNSNSSATVSISGGYFKAEGKGPDKYGRLIYGKASVSGGYFGGIDYSPVESSQMAEGYEMITLTGSESDDTDVAAFAAGYQLKATAAAPKVAQIGSTKYATLADAIAAVQGDQTIKLIADVTVSSTEEYVGKNFVLDGDGHTIDMSSAITTSTYPLAFGDGDFSFSNTSFTSGWTSTNKQNYNVLIYGENKNTTAQLSNVSISADSQTALCVQGWGAIKTTATLENMTITNTGSRTGSDEYRSAAVATAFGGIVIINSGTYTSQNGQAVRQFSSGGDITINGGVFSGKIVAHLDKGSYSQYPAIITINGGTFNNCSFDVIHNNGDTSANIVIYGGTFDCDPSAYVATGYEAVANVNGTWTVSQAAVAQIGSVKYTSLEAAVAAATSGQTIELLADVDLSSHARSAADDIILTNITLDLNGKTIRTL